MTAVKLRVKPFKLPKVILQLDFSLFRSKFKSKHLLRASDLILNEAVRQTFFLLQLRGKTSIKSYPLSSSGLKPID